MLRLGFKQIAFGGGDSGGGGGDSGSTRAPTSSPRTRPTARPTDLMDRYQGSSDRDDSPAPVAAPAAFNAGRGGDPRQFTSRSSVITTTGTPGLATPTSPGSLVDSPAFRRAFPGANVVTSATPRLATPTSPGSLVDSPAFRAAFPGASTAPAAPSATVTELPSSNLGGNIASGIASLAGRALRLSPLTATLMPSPLGIGTIPEDMWLQGYPGDDLMPGVDLKWQDPAADAMMDDAVRNLPAATPEVFTLPELVVTRAPDRKMMTADSIGRRAEIAAAGRPTPQLVDQAPPQPAVQEAPDRKMMTADSFARRAAIAAAGRPAPQVVSQTSAAPTQDMFLTDEGRLTQFAIDTLNIRDAEAGDEPFPSELEAISAAIGTPVSVAADIEPPITRAGTDVVSTGTGTTAPVSGTTPRMGIEDIAPPTPPRSPTPSSVPGARPETVTLPTTDPETGERGTVNVSFQEYASLPRDEEGFLDLGSPEAQLLNLDVQRPADYGTPEGFALEDMLYFGEDSMRSRMQEPPTGLENLLRGTMLGSVLGPMSDRQQQIAYNQLVQGPNYRGTPIAPTGNFLYDSAAGLFGDQSLDQDAANYVAVTENGQIIGSLAVDAAGNPVGYRGTRSANAEIMDPSIDPAAAMAFISPEQAMGGGGGEPVADATFDPCPEGYTYNPETQICELDESAAEESTSPEAEATVPPQVVTEVTPAAGYTSLGPLSAYPMLSPQPGFRVLPQSVAPISVPAQTGLASLRV